MAGGRFAAVCQRVHACSDQLFRVIERIFNCPGAVAFGNYVAFGSALAASTTFGATCTSYLPYTVVTSPTGGAIAGLNYTLLLTPPVGPSGTSLNATGSGALQTYTVNGSMAAGQAGLCPAGSCAGTLPHTLTLSY